MCEASIYAPHRKAQAKERLVVQAVQNYQSMHGLYPADQSGGDTKLVCVIGHTPAIIKRVVFMPNQNLGTIRDKWEHKRNVAVTLRRSGHSDLVTLPDGNHVGLNNLNIGMRIDIGIPVRKRAPRKITGDKGMAVVEQALTEVKKTKVAPARKRTPAKA